MNKLLLLLLLFICISCSSNRPIESNQSICEQLQEMVDRDQAIRKEDAKISDYYSRLILINSDSLPNYIRASRLRRLQWLYWRSDLDLDTAIKNFDYKVNRSRINEFFFKSDSVNTLMFEVDKKNVKAM